MGLGGDGGKPVGDDDRDVAAAPFGRAGAKKLKRALVEDAPPLGVEEVVGLVGHHRPDAHVAEPRGIELAFDELRVERRVDGVAGEGVREAEVEQVHRAQASARAAHGEARRGELPELGPRISGQVRAGSRQEHSFLLYA